MGRRGAAAAARTRVSETWRRRLWLWTAERASPQHLRAAVRGDLLEEWHALRHSRGAGAADRWLRHESLRSAPTLFGMRMRRTHYGTHQPVRRESRMGTLVRDLRHAGRMLGRTPGTTAMVALTLGAGIAACTVVLSMVDGLVLNPFPFPEPHGLVGIGSAYPRLDRELGYFENMSPPEFADVRDSSRTLEHVVAWDMGQRAISVDGVNENLLTAFWWGDAFTTLGMPPALGRGFTDEETVNGEAVAIISWRVFRERFGADSSLVGGTVRVNGTPYTLVGVMPPRALIYGTDMWMPMSGSPQVYERGGRQFQVLARLKPGATLESANTELEMIARRTETAYAQQHPEYDGWSMHARTWNDINVQGLRTMAFVLLGAVMAVLLLVCTNVASLLVGRAAGRSRELAVRAALGAGRGALVRQLLTESLVLALAGGVLGIALGWAGVRVLADVISSLATEVPGEIAVNLRVLTVSVLVTVLAGVLFGLAPALHTWRTDLRGALSEGANSLTLTRRRLRIQRTLVAVEVALSVVLLTGGGLLIHSFLKLHAVDPGFRTENVLTMRLTLARNRYETDQMEPFFRQLSERVSALPGVRTAAIANQFPPMVGFRFPFQVENVPAPGDALPIVVGSIVSPGYFETLGIPLVRGRVFAANDRAGTPLVAVINQAAAASLFTDADPVGRRLRVGGEGEWLEIVGVVADTRNAGLDAAPEPEIFVNTQQGLFGWNQLFLLVSTDSDPYAILPSIRREVAAMDAEQPIYMIRTVAETFAQRHAPRRIATTTLSLFGVFALLLATLGIYGVSAYAVSQRKREIGLRMALGASPGSVLSLVTRQSLIPVAIGAVAGLAGALIVGNVLRDMLFGVGSIDAVTLLGVMLLLAAIATLASWLPARRGTQLDPVVALRALQ